MSPSRKVRNAPRLRRPGGRAERVRLQVANGVLKFIGDGHVDFSYNQLAEASHINKTTLYRRWPQRADLLKEALKEHNSRLRFPTSKSWPDSAVALIREAAKFFAQPIEIAMDIALLSQPTSEAHSLIVEQWEPVQDAIVQLAKDAQARGELSADIDPDALMLMMMAPLLVLTWFERAPVDRKMVNGLVKIVRRMHFRDPKR